jgi:hypothetical protein
MTMLGVTAATSSLLLSSPLLSLVVGVMVGVLVGLVVSVLVVVLVVTGYVQDGMIEE